MTANYSDSKCNDSRVQWILRGTYLEFSRRNLSRTDRDICTHPEPKRTESELSYNIIMKISNDEIYSISVQSIKQFIININKHAYVYKYTCIYNTKIIVYFI